MQKQKNIPSLRFPEFTEQWEVKKLDNYIEILSGIALKGDEITDDRNGISILRGINITEGYIRHSYEIDRYFVCQELSKVKKYLLKIDDLVLGMDGSKVGKNVALITSKDENSILIQRVARLRANKKSNIQYIYQNIFSKKFHDYVDIVNTSSGIPHISLQQIKDFEVGFPTLPEQTKIAEFFTAIDEKIQALKKKKTLLEAYKKGIMQQLFSQKLRFKDENGNDFPDWEVKKLGEVAKRKTLKNKEGNNNVLTISAQFGLISQLEFFKKSVSAKDVTGYYLLENGDFAYNKSYSNGYPMGAIKCLNRYEKGVVSTLYICFKFNDNISNPFMEHYFETGIHNNEIEKVAQEGARNHGLLNIGLEDFFSIELKIPTLPEQVKIANFLSSIDEKISQTQKQLAQTEVWKKGLLQKMFV